MAWKLNLALFALLPSSFQPVLCSGLLSPMFAYLRWVNRWCFKRFLVTLKLSLCCQGQLIFAMDILRFITKEGACSPRWCYIFCNILFSGFRASSWSCCCHGNKVLSLFDSEWDRCLTSYVSPIFRMDVRWRFFSRSIWWQCSPFSWYYEKALGTAMFPQDGGREEEGV